jgi:limonene-1,2-epoxide hydrolase
MSKQTPEEIVRLFMSAMEKLDYDTAMTYVTDDVVYCNMPLGVSAGTVVGPSGIRSVLEPFFGPTITNEWVIKNVAVAGNVVFMERLDRHQLSKGWAELPVTGVFEVTNNKISAWRDYFDWATISSAMVSLS